MSDFTKDEIIALKELARERLQIMDLREGAEYRNRFETEEDAKLNKGRRIE